MVDAGVDGPCGPAELKGIIPPRPEKITPRPEKNTPGPKNLSGLGRIFSGPGVIVQAGVPGPHPARPGDVSCTPTRGTRRAPTPPWARPGGVSCTPTQGFRSIPPGHVPGAFPAPLLDAPARAPRLAKIAPRPEKNRPRHEKSFGPGSIFSGLGGGGPILTAMRC